jgi:hypothetical protein
MPNVTMPKKNNVHVKLQLFSIGYPDSPDRSAFFGIIAYVSDCLFFLILC